MRVNSTGLGKTTMVANFGVFDTVVAEKIAGQYEGKEGDYVVLSVNAFEPVHWNIKITLGGKDLRRCLLKAMKPRIAFRMLWLLLRGNDLDDGRGADPVPGHVRERTGVEGV